ncbi:hypothetical protein HID58_012516 [Brassica napus]|uniref:Uncharacterized protein n=1 Tax=Brassica napus TaxID=3708 RepID=A0ABQ8E1B6_BRANA|nr:hypothetical protein HID58_012516 [Brassica napus]
MVNKGEEAPLVEGLEGAPLACQIIGYALNAKNLSLSTSLRQKAISTSPSVARVGVISIDVSYRRHHLWWLALATSLSIKHLLGLIVCWFSLNLSLGGSSPRSFPSVPHLKSKEPYIKNFPLELNILVSLKCKLLSIINY